MDNVSSSPAAGCRGPDHHPGMIRLPIAPRINHRIRFGPMSCGKEQYILPATAVTTVRELTAHGSTADAVLLDGPGDPLAEIEPTLQTITALKEAFPGLRIVVKTLGINGLKYADKLTRAGCTEVELQLSAIDPEILEKIYAWVRPGFKTLKLQEAVTILLAEQHQAIQAFKDAGMRVRLITTLYPTVNDEHLVILAKKARDIGVDEIVVQPYTPEQDADITLPAPDEGILDALVEEMNAIVTTAKGRPVASGPLVEATLAANLPKPSAKRPNVAVVSTNGMDIDLHLGQAPQILVYGPREDGLTCLLECRKAPEPGLGSDRWDKLADQIPDCFALLAASAGERPKQILSNHNIQVIVSTENIEGTVDVLYGGGKKGKGQKPQQPFT